MFKKNGKYYFMWVRVKLDRTGLQGRLRHLRFSFGPFNRIGEVLRQNSRYRQRSGSPLDHACAEFGRLLHRVPSPAGRGQETRDHQETCIEKMTFNEEGLINPVEITTEGVEARTIQ